MDGAWNPRIRRGAPKGPGATGDIAVGNDMRVLMIHNRYLERGGEDKSFESEAALLRERGCTVFTYEESNERIERLGNLRVAAKSIWSSETYGNIRKQLRENRCDILHVQNHFPLISPSAYYAAHAEGTAVVQALRNYRLICPTGAFYRQQKVCEDCLGRAFAWPSMIHSCYRGSAFASGSVAAMLSVHRLLGTWRRKVDVYVAPTFFARDKFVESGFDPEKLMVKYNFVAPDPGMGTGGGGYALFVGRLAKEKGIDTMLSAWRKLAGDFPLWIAADKTNMAQFSGTVEQSRSVEWLGWRNETELLDILGKAEMLILPSEWYEGHPRVAVEAFAKGVPIIGSNLGAMAEIIEDGRTGLLFEPGNADDLAAKLRWALDHPDRLLEMRKRARSEYETKYMAAANFGRMMEIYQAAIDRFKGGERGREAAVQRADPLWSSPLANDDR